MRVIIDDNRLVAMAKDDRFLQAFPFLRQIVDTKKRGCACNGGRSRVNAQALAGAREALARGTEAQKKMLLQLLGAAEGSISYLDSKRKKVTVLF